MKKLTLLIADADGVFMSLKSVVLRRKDPTIANAIAELNTFCAETRALIAPISARLRITSPVEFHDTMRAAGFTGEFHPRLAVPRSLRPFTRGADLDKFLKEENIGLDQCVIADDAPRYYTPSQLLRLVRPDATVGFNAENREQAKKLLKHHLNSSTSELAYLPLAPMKRIELPEHLSRSKELPWQKRVAKPPEPPERGK